MRKHTLVSSFAVTSHQEMLFTSDKTAIAPGCALWLLPGQFQPKAGLHLTLKYDAFSSETFPIKCKQFRLELLKTDVSLFCPCRSPTVNTLCLALQCSSCQLCYIVACCFLCDFLSFLSLNVLQTR